MDGLQELITGIRCRGEFPSRPPNADTRNLPRKAPVPTFDNIFLTTNNCIPPGQPGIGMSATSP